MLVIKFVCHLCIATAAIEVNQLFLNFVTMSYRIAALTMYDVAI
ncbi:MAG: hypothetical protein ABIT58_06010 [Ferruginibacter sp.]